MIQGIFLYLIVGLLKSVLLKIRHEKISGFIFFSLGLDFSRKGAPTFMFSFLQLWGLVWIGIGILETLFSRYIEQAPVLLVSSLEFFCPFLIAIGIVKLVTDRNKRV